MYAILPEHSAVGIMRSKMENKVLVAYASKHGGTAEIADRIGHILQQAGLQAEVLPIQRVKDISKYGTVVLGSAIYIAMWRKEAIKFLMKNQKLLSTKPVWLFSSGPLGEGNPVDLSQGWRFPEKQRPLIDSIKPRDIALFHGIIDLNKMNFLEKWTINKVKAPTGDYRDWDMITTWANDIAIILKKSS